MSRKVDAGAGLRRPVVAVALAMGVVGISTTGVGVASRGMADELGLSLTALSWVVGGYLLTAAMFALVGGRLGDVIGRARTFLLGIVVMAVGALLAMVAPGTGVLIAGRLVQGVGAALVLPSSIELVAAYPPAGGPSRGFRVRGAVYATSFGVGPLIGGILTDTISWRAIFGAELLVLVAAAVTAAPLLSRPSELPHPRTHDVTGAVLSALAVLVGVGAAFGVATWGWWSWPTVLSAVAVVVLVAVLIRIEAHVDHPLLHPGLWRNRLVVGANVATIAASIGMIGLIYFFNLFAQSGAAFDRPALAVAAALAPFAISIVLFAHIAAFLSDRFGYRGPVVIGLGISIVGFVWLSTTTASTTEVALVAPLVLCGVGAGIANAGLTTPAVLSEGHQRMDEAAGILSLSRFVGSALAIAIGTSTYLSVSVPATAGTTESSGEVAVGGSAYHEAVSQLSQDLRAPFEAAARSQTAEAFASTMRLTAGVLLVLTVLAAWLVRPSHTSPTSGG